MPASIQETCQSAWKAPAVKHHLPCGSNNLLLCSGNMGIHLSDTSARVGKSAKLKTTFAQSSHESGKSKNVLKESQATHLPSILFQLVRLGWLVIRTLRSIGIRDLVSTASAIKNAHLKLRMCGIRRQTTRTGPLMGFAVKNFHPRVPKTRKIKLVEGPVGTSSIMSRTAPWGKCRITSGM